MNTGAAVELLKIGARVRRAGWNGKGMHLELIRSGSCGIVTTEGPCQPVPWVAMKAADGRFVPWLCSQADLLAEDWEALQ